MLYIAIDGGGTKTEGILTDGHQAVLAHRTVGASNPHDLTLSVSVQVLTSLVRALITDAGIALKGSTATEISLFAGIAGVLGYRDAMREALTNALYAMTAEKDLSTVRFSHVGLDSDIAILFSAELDEGDGACVISGTGSVCFLRQGKTDEAKGAGGLVRIGGWGYLLDTGGNGYSIGRDALEAALRAHDGRGQATTLSELLAAHLGRSVPDAINDIYTGGKSFIASCAPSVFQAADGGDPVAENILRRNADALAELITVASRKRGQGDPPLPVVLGGGLFQNRPDWVARVKDALAEDVAVSVRLTVASQPPVMGALTLARKLHHI